MKKKQQPTDSEIEEYIVYANQEIAKTKLLLAETLGLNNVEAAIAIPAMVEIIADLNAALKLPSATGLLIAHFRDYVKKRAQEYENGKEDT